MRPGGNSEHVLTSNTGRRKDIWGCSMRTFPSSLSASLCRGRIRLSRREDMPSVSHHNQCSLVLLLVVPAVDMLRNYSKYSRLGAKPALRNTKRRYASHRRTFAAAYCACCTRNTGQNKGDGNSASPTESQPRCASGSHRTTRG